MGLLTIVQKACGRLNIPVPSTVMGNTDTQILQLMRLSEAEGNDLAKRADWNMLTHEVTFTPIADEDQGNILTIAAMNALHWGFWAIKNGTFWDRTNKLPIMGPLSDQEWQQRKALTTAGARYFYRIRGNHLLVTPTPPATGTWAFEYLSEYWIINNAETAFTFQWAVDSDKSILSEDLILLGLLWRWKKEKGLDYAEDFQTYENQVKLHMTRDGGKRKLYMDGEVRDARPGILVPDQSWSLP